MLISIEAEKEHAQERLNSFLRVQASLKAAEHMFKYIDRKTFVEHFCKLNNMDITELQETIEFINEYLENICF